MIEALRPDVVGHVDLVRLFRPEQPLTPPIRAACTAALQAGVHHGCIFEINTSGLRKGLRGPYPHDDVLHVSGGGDNAPTLGRVARQTRP